MTDERQDWQRRADELAAEARAAGEPTSWFERLYAEGAGGAIELPWGRTDPHAALRSWASDSGLEGSGRRAVVVGCGLGADAAYLASLGFATTGFDLSSTAIEVARSRHAGIDFQVADLSQLPPEWLRAFDLVVEIFTLQAVPDPPRTSLAQGVTDLVADGGTLLAVQYRADGTAPLDDGPPYPLERSFLESLARDGLTLASLEELDGPLWRGVYHR